MMPSALLFDMDGLLVDTEPLWLAAQTELGHEFGFLWTIEDQANCLGGPLLRIGHYFNQRTSGRNDTLANAEQIVKMLIDSMVARVSRQSTALMLGGRELLDHLAHVGLPYALVSASPRRLVDAVLESAAMTFPITVAGDEVERTKPFPDAYLKAATLLEVPIERCLVLEDSPTGVAAGIASGAQIIAIPHICEIEATDRVSVKKSLIEVLDELIGLGM